MARIKRTPFDPNKVYDRRATEFNRGTVQHVVAVEVDDPMGLEAGDKIIVMASTRDDPLKGLHSRRQITEDQFYAGRAYQADFEKIERGPKATDPSQPYVDCSMAPQYVSTGFSEALVRLNRSAKDLGIQGSALTHHVLIGRKSYREIAEMHGRSDERAIRYVGMRFVECLDCLALVYGLAMASNNHP